jgi:hypothetical protein
MKRATVFAGFAAAGLMAGTSAAFAHGDHAKADQTSSTEKSTSATADQKASTTEKGASATADQKSLSGKIASVDQKSNSVTIASDTGTQQEVKVSDKTHIMRDGSSVSFTQLQSGDQVRASFDPSTKQATKLEVESKAKKQ